MGWFDNEEGGETGNASAAGNPQRPNMKVATPAPPAPQGSGSGSTLGRQVRIDGTIVCGEDLTILGKVEGTIRAKGTLVIAENADVRAAIDGQRVLVHGKVEGDVHGEEKVVLGPTAHLNGNIDVSALEILEGAYFKGNVEMKSATKAQKPAPPSKSEKPSGQVEAKGASVAQGKVEPDKKKGLASGAGAQGAGAQGSGAGKGSKKEDTKPGGGPGS
jgi:cytoskeletal protein CcmA (bactofilin family)